MIMVHRRLGAGCGCDAPDPRTGLIGIEEALTRLVAQIEPVPGTERLGLSDVVGRVLAEPVRALSDMPRFDHSAMDGYAIRRAGLSGNGPWRLPVVLRCAAGHGTLPDLPEGAAAHVFTGAPIPFGADCVVPQEAVRRHADRIEIPLRPPTGANIRTRGEEWSAGNPILPRGTRVTARSVAAAAAAGHAAMIVRRRLRITLLVSGAEIVAPGAPDPRDGTIWDVNTPMLRAALARPDVRIVAMDRIPDDAEGTRVALAEAARVSDLIVTTGGVSVGEEDHLRAAFAEIGGVEIFSGVAMKPGKPVTCGVRGKVAWLGLPGNPQAAFVTWTLFGTALARRLSGLARPENARRHVVLAHAVTRKPGRCELRAATVVGTDGQGRDVVECSGPVHSGQVGGLAAADGLVLLPAEADALPEAALVEFHPFCSE